MGLYGREDRTRKEIDEMTKEQKLLYGSLDNYWQTIVDSLVQSLYDVGRVASGATAQSIGQGNTKPVTLTASGFNISVAMPDYYEYIDEGVSGSKNNKGISRFKYTDKRPPISAIRKFMLNRGINSPKRSNTTSGKRRDAESIRNGIAYAIAYKIFTDGQKPTNFYSNVINDKQLLDFEAKLLEQFSDYVVSIVRVD